jgi:hypothetical protein
MIKEILWGAVGILIPALIVSAVAVVIYAAVTR